MRPEAKGYILKEYGSWSVLTVAYLIGLGVSTTFPWQAIPVFIALGLLINSKQAYTKWVRQPSFRKHSVVFLVQVLAAASVLATVYGDSLPQLLPLLVVPAGYLLMNRIAGEHHILTELLGFAVLSMAAVLANYLIARNVDMRLYIGVALYFTANVFKIKAMLLKKTRDRVLTGLSVLFAVSAYHAMHIPVIILLPLADNLIVSAMPYRVKLQTTGWIEVTKSLIVLGLFIAFYG